MADNTETRREGEERNKDRSWIGLIIRFIVAAIVLMITAYVTPGFSRMSFGTALLAAIIIAALDYIIQKVFKIDASPFGRGIIGFITAAVIIYITQFIVPGMEVTLLGAIIGAAVIGIIDAIIPTNVV
ncbi:MAG TPA: phage holin family protein [Candidatus Atribacteria bacterium]|nr:phage holin family protein [Candidatus Atribacteria bacterium]